MSDWVLKVVGAAVQAQARQLEFKFSRVKTVVRLLKSPRTSLDYSELKLATESLSESHEIVLQDGSSHLEIELRRRKRKLEFKQQLRERIYSVANNSKLLQSRARFAPLVLKVDGRIICSEKYDCKPAKTDGLSGGTDFETPLFWAGVATKAGVTQEHAITVADKRILSDPLMSERFFATFKEPDISASPLAHLILVASCTQAYRAKEFLDGAPFAEQAWVTECKSTDFYLHFSRKGVIYESFRATAPLGGEFHLPCDDLETSPAQILTYLGRTKPLLEELRERILEHQPTPNLPKPNVKSVAKTAALLGSTTFGFGALWGLNLLAATKVGLATGGGISALKTLRTRQLDRDGVEEIAKAVGLFCNSLGKDGLDFQKCDLPQ